MKRAVIFCAIAGCVLIADVLSLQGLPEGRWAHTPAVAQPVEETRQKTTRPSSRSSRATIADTTRRSVTAGDVLITTLPDTLDRQPVTSYEMMRTPALSGQTDRSFFWRTRAADEGRHTLLFRVRFAQAPPDTLAMVVTVRPAE